MSNDRLCVLIQLCPLPIAALSAMSLALGFLLCWDTLSDARRWRSFEDFIPLDVLILFHSTAKATTYISSSSCIHKGTAYSPSAAVFNSFCFYGLFTWLAGGDQRFRLLNRAGLNENEIDDRATTKTRRIFQTCLTLHISRSVVNVCRKIHLTIAPSSAVDSWSETLSPLVTRALPILWTFKMTVTASSSSTRHESHPPSPSRSFDLHWICVDHTLPSLGIGLTTGL